MRKFKILFTLLFITSNSLANPGVTFSPTGGGSVDYVATSASVVQSGLPSAPTMSVFSSMSSGGIFDTQSLTNNRKMNVNLFIENKSTSGTTVDYTIDLASKYDAATASGVGVSVSPDASDVLLVSSFVGNVNANLTGYVGSAGKSISKLCSEKILAGEYGVTVKNAYSARRTADTTLPAKCDDVDIASINASLAPACGVGSYDAAKDGIANATFNYNIAVKKRKCERITPKTLCKIKTRVFKCALGPTVNTHMGDTGGWRISESYRITDFGNKNIKFSRGRISANAGGPWNNSSYDFLMFSIDAPPNIFPYACTGFNGSSYTPDSCLPQTYGVYPGGDALNTYGMYINSYSNFKSIFNSVFQLPTTIDVTGYIFKIATNYGATRYEFSTDATSGSANKISSFLVKDTYPGSAYANIEVNRKNPQILSTDFNMDSSCGVINTYGPVNNWTSYEAVTRTSIKTGLVYTGDKLLADQTIDYGTTCSDWLNASSRTNKANEFAETAGSQNVITYEYVGENDLCPNGTTNLGLTTAWANTDADYLAPGGYQQNTCEYGIACAPEVSSTFLTSQQRGAILRPTSGETGSYGGKLNVIAYQADSAQVTADITNGSNGSNGSIDVTETELIKYCADIRDNTGALRKNPVISLEKIKFFPWDMRPASYIESKTFPARVPADYVNIFTDVSEPFRDYLKRQMCPTCP